MPVVAARADQVRHSGIREIVNLVARRGGDIIRLEVGEPGFATPDHIVKAGAAAAEAGARYTHSAGTLELREALSGKLAEVNGLEADPDRVVVCHGAVQACAVILAALLEPGDEVVLPDPAWPNYEMLVRLYGGVPVRYPLRAEAGFVPDPAELERLVGGRTRAIIVNSPGNPTGAVIPAAVIEALTAVAARHDVTLLCDEVYDELIFEGRPANAVAYDPEHVAGIYSFSKTYAMTGWRIGYVLAPVWLAPTLAKLQEPLLSCASAVSQAAALAAVTGPQDCVATMRDGYRARRDLVVGRLRDAGITAEVPRGAFYLMLPLASGVDARQAAIALLDHGVSVAPGTAFGNVAADHLRLSLASSEADLREGLARITSWYRDTEGGRG